MKSKKTKKALTGSVLALVLCFVMLLGTTFAWFTDTASTSVNSIQAGNLKVELLDAETNESLEGQTLNFKKAANHENEAILWEPGCTYELQPVVIKNTGNLALKYKVVVSAINGSSDLAKVLEVYMLEGEKTAGATAPYGTLRGTLNDMLAAGVATQEKSLAPDETTKKLTISLHMKEEAGNEYQDLSIDSIAITVYAKQDTVEFDSSTNQYDAAATYSNEVWDGKTLTVVTKNTEDNKYHITNAAEFAWFVSGEGAIPAGSNVVLDADIDLNGATVKGYANGVFDSNFDGQNHTVRNFTVKTTYTEDTRYCGLFPYILGGCSVKNLTVKDATALGSGLSQVGIISGAAYENTTVENCHVINCTVVGEKKVGGVLGYTNGTVKDCTATDCVIYCADSNVAQSGEVIGYTDGEGSVTSCSNANVTVNRGVTPVSSAAELAAALDNAGNALSYDRNIVLTADIDGSTWTAISGGSNYPAVTIDGNGHTIKNLSSCLFSSLPARDYVFKNINFTNVNLTEASGSNAGLGVIVGEAQSNGGYSYTITNCHINGGKIYSETESDAGKYVGGFIGRIDGVPTVTVTNCSVSNLELNTFKSVGGIIGYAYGGTLNITLDGCAVKGNTTITARENRAGSTATAGKLIGTLYNGANATIESCTVGSTVTLSNTGAEPANDGLVGRVLSGSSVTVQ